MNARWEDKEADLETIDIPAYCRKLYEPHPHLRYFGRLSPHFLQGKMAAHSQYRRMGRLLPQRTHRGVAEIL